jgi:hypothetical protein
MSHYFLVQTSDGHLVRRAGGELKPTDRVVVDGPDAFKSASAAQRELEAEIAAAGGLEAWRANQNRDTD